MAASAEGRRRSGGEALGEEALSVIPSSPGNIFLPSLPCFRSMFSHLISTSDVLLVCARNLGARILLCRLIRLYKTINEFVFVLGGRRELACVRVMLEADGVASDELPRLLDSGTTAAERRGLTVRGGGVYFASSQQLLVDLLAGRIDARRVRGVIVYDAHRVTDTSKEGFALRLFKEKNPEGFVKALCEDPEALSAGFGRLQNTMRWLHVSKVFLWPRFHDLVRRDLDASQFFSVTEELIEFTPAMQNVQRAIVACQDAALDAIKAACPGVDIDALCSGSGALFDNFNDLLRRHIMTSAGGGAGGAAVLTKPAVKAAQRELGFMRKLLHYLVRYDAVSLYSYLNTERITALKEERRGDWILAERGEAVLAAAKRRVYQTKAQKLEAGRGEEEGRGVEAGGRKRGVGGVSAAGAEGGCARRAADAPHAHVINLDPPRVQRAVEPREVVVDVVLRIEAAGVGRVVFVADPARDAPREPVGADCGISLLCLDQYCPLVSSRAVQIAAHVHVRQFRALEKERGKVGVRDLRWEARGKGGALGRTSVDCVSPPISTLMIYP